MRRHEKADGELGRSRQASSSRPCAGPAYRGKVHGDAQIEAWRAMVDCVMIDPAFDGAVLNVMLSDVPEKKTASWRAHTRYRYQTAPRP